MYHHDINIDILNKKKDNVSNNPTASSLVNVRKQKTTTWIPILPWNLDIEDVGLSGPDCKRSFHSHFNASSCFGWRTSFAWWQTE